MAKEPRYKMSQERYDKLVEELNYLQTVREKEVAELIKEARSFGDLSENSEYDEAKTEQGKLYSRIAEIKNLIDNAEITEKSKDTNKVTMGNKVTVLDLEFNETVTYQIVGSQEADPMAGRISDDSPLGSAILGAKAGETVTINAPDGEFKYQIVSIQK